MVWLEVLAVTGELEAALTGLLVQEADRELLLVGLKELGGLCARLGTVALTLDDGDGGVPHQYGADQHGQEDGGLLLQAHRPDQYSVG
ncbi:MAG TPA: hypothetical protein VIJ91_12025 [Candidatus Dormibacteraeota bacterium]